MTEAASAVQMGSGDGSYAAAAALDGTARTGDGFLGAEICRINNVTCFRKME